MEGRRVLQIPNNKELGTQIEAAPRSVNSTHKLKNMNTERGKDTFTKKKHTNNKNLMIGIVGCCIVGAICYILVSDYTLFS